MKRILIFLLCLGLGACATPQLKIGLYQNDALNDFAAPWLKKQQITSARKIIVGYRNWAIIEKEIEDKANLFHYDEQKKNELILKAKEDYKHYITFDCRLASYYPIAEAYMANINDILKQTLKSIKDYNPKSISKLPDTMKEEIDRYDTVVFTGDVCFLYDEKGNRIPLEKVIHNTESPLTLTNYLTTVYTYNYQLKFPRKNNEKKAIITPESKYIKLEVIGAHRDTLTSYKYFLQWDNIAQSTILSEE